MIEIDEYPNEAITVLMNAWQEGRLKKEKVEALSSVLNSYLMLRQCYIYLGNK